MNLLTLGAAFAAGILTVLSPCVLPILPIIFGSATAKSRWGPAALAAGVAIAFTVVGLFIATIGFSLGLNEDVFHKIAGFLLIAFGLALLVPRLQALLERALGPFSRWASERTARIDAGGLWGQAGLGVLLGAVWSPCVGPTLGAASLLASQGKNLGSASVTMLAFGLGAAMPLLFIGQASRTVLSRVRGGLRSTGRIGKLLLGGGMLIAGVLAFSGFDKTLETILVNASPLWLMQLTSSI
jgi:cytochrome c-type biogenesis protein